MSSPRNYWTVPELIADWKFWRYRNVYNEWDARSYREKARASWSFLMKRWGAKKHINEHVMDQIEGRDTRWHRPMVRRR